MPQVKDVAQIRTFIVNRIGSLEAPPAGSPSKKPNPKMTQTQKCPSLSQQRRAQTRTVLFNHIRATLPDIRLRSPEIVKLHFTPTSGERYRWSFSNGYSLPHHVYTKETADGKIERETVWKKAKQLTLEEHYQMVEAIEKGHMKAIPYHKLPKSQATGLEVLDSESSSSENDASMKEETPYEQMPWHNPSTSETPITNTDPPTPASPASSASPAASRPFLAPKPPNRHQEMKLNQLKRRIEHLKETLEKKRTSGSRKDALWLKERSLWMKKDAFWLKEKKAMMKEKKDWMKEKKKWMRKEKAWLNGRALSEERN
ncbi:hypothetical protein BJ508DRAFT_327334 [Ascobolus immersus RN42]|uniref:Uncharacterized protein n=1 Tax=Ascobolus immersus RN42 TaxID=1160509 RepID=A0A3N4I357_ASCIM|nr:hypothetical protein BJ508DRAFT_327334 [Ascobolus immersus RN42]